VRHWKRCSGGAHSEQQRAARDLLHALSWRAEKLFRQRGHLHGYVWLTEDVFGKRQWFETDCEAYPDIADGAALAALRTELREDFKHDGIVRYGVAFPATATTVMRQSILHLNGEQVRQQVICIERTMATCISERNAMFTTAASRRSLQSSERMVALRCYAE
jgi:hypothetical protein